MLKFISMLTLMSVACASEAAEFSFVPPWSLQSMLGLMSMHDGANCFNATLAAKGYSDYLAQSSEVELSYFLETFCNENSGAWRAGDVITLSQTTGFEHSMISMDGKDTIFDKNGIAGVYGVYQSERIFDYRIHKTTDSEYFVNCAANHCTLKAYTCPSAAVVRPAIAACAQAPAQGATRAFLEEMQARTFNSNRKANLSPTMFSLIKKMIFNIDGLRGDEKCAVYMLATAASAYDHTENALYEEQYGTPSWRASSENLGRALKTAKARILKYRKDAKTATILNYSL